MHATIILFTKTGVSINIKKFVLGGKATKRSFGLSTTHALFVSFLLYSAKVTSSVNETAHSNDDT